MKYAMRGRSTPWTIAVDTCDCIMNRRSYGGRCPCASSSPLCSFASFRQSAREVLAVIAPVVEIQGQSITYCSSLEGRCIRRGGVKEGESKKGHWGKPPSESCLGQGHGKGTIWWCLRLRIRHRIWSFMIPLPGNSHRSSFGLLAFGGCNVILHIRSL